MKRLLRTIRADRRPVRAACALLAAALLFPALPARAQDESFTLEQLLADMAKVGAVRQRFTETKTLAMLKEPLTFSGEMSYARPGRIEKHTVSPADERLTVDGDTLVWDNAAKGAHRRVDIRRSPELWAYVEGIRATLAGDAAALARFYRPALRGTRGRWTLTLEPAGDAARRVRSIRIKGSGDRIARIEVVDANGDRDVTALDAGTAP